MKLSPRMRPAPHQGSAGNMFIGTVSIDMKIALEPLKEVLARMSNSGFALRHQSGPRQHCPEGGGRGFDQSIT